MIRTCIVIPFIKSVLTHDALSSILLDKKYSRFLTKATYLLGTVIVESLEI